MRGPRWSDERDPTSRVARLTALLGWAGQFVKKEALRGDAYAQELSEKIRKELYGA